MLAPPLDGARHPAFSKLFVGSELLPGANGLLFTRRPRDAGDRPPVLLHRVIADDKGFTPRGVETDRAAFLARHGNQRSEEHTSELQSLMRISYDVFCLKKKTNKTRITIQ